MRSEVCCERSKLLEEYLKRGGTKRNGESALARCEGDYQHTHCGGLYQDFRGMCYDSTLLLEREEHLGSTSMNG